MINRTTGHTRDLARIAMVASLYIALSLTVSFLTFGPIQFRFAEMLMLLVVYNRKYAFSMILGCFIVNLFSPLGWVDVVFGTGATVIACLMMLPIKNLWVASIMPTLSCVIIAAELHYVVAAPFWFTVLTVLAGEFIVVTVIGCPLMKLILRNNRITQLIGLNRNFGKKAVEPPTFDDSDTASFELAEKNKSMSDTNKEPTDIDD